MALTYEPLGTSVISGTTTTSVTFSSLGTNFDDLVIVIHTTSIVGTGAVRIQLNNDGGAYYAWQQINATTASSVSGTNSGDQNYLQITPGANASNNYSTAYYVNIFSARDTYPKAILVQSSNVYPLGTGRIGMMSGIYNPLSNTAISSVTVLTSGTGFGNNTRITVYGIKRA